MQDSFTISESTNADLNAVPFRLSLMTWVSVFALPDTNWSMENAANVATDKYSIGKAELASHGVE